MHPSNTNMKSTGRPRDWTPAPLIDRPSRCSLCLSHLSHRGRLTPLSYSCECTLAKTKYKMEFIFVSSIVQDTVETSYSIDLCSHDLITTSWWQCSCTATRKQYSSESVAELLQCQWSRLQLQRQTIPARRARHCYNTTLLLFSMSLKLREMRVAQKLHIQQVLTMTNQCPWAQCRCGWPGWLPSNSTWSCAASEWRSSRVECYCRSEHRWWTRSTGMCTADAAPVATIKQQ